MRKIKNEEEGFSLILFWRSEREKGKKKKKEEEECNNLFLYKLRFMPFEIKVCVMYVYI